MTYRRTAIGLSAILMFSVSMVRADAVLDWNEIMVTLVQDQPPVVIRVTAITQLAVFEAVNAVAGEYEPYLGSVTAAPGASADAAAVSAAHRALRNYFPDHATPWMLRGRNRSPGFLMGAPRTAELPSARRRPTP